MTCYRNASIERLTWSLIYNWKTKKSSAQPQKESAFREYFANYSRTKALRNILKPYLEFFHMNLLPGKFFPKRKVTWLSKKGNYLEIYQRLLHYNNFNICYSKQIRPNINKYICSLLSHIFHFQVNWFQVEQNKTDKNWARYSIVDDLVNNCQHTQIRWFANSIHFIHRLNQLD